VGGAEVCVAGHVIRERKVGLRGLDAGAKGKRMVNEGLYNFEPVVIIVPCDIFNGEARIGSTRGTTVLLLLLRRGRGSRLVGISFSFVLRRASLLLAGVHGIGIRLGTSPGPQQVLMGILVGILVGNVTHGSGSPANTGPRGSGCGFCVDGYPL